MDQEASRGDGSRVGRHQGAFASVKPRESSEEGAKGLSPREAGGESGQLATAALVPPLLPGRNESGVVPAPALDRRGAETARQALAAELHGVARDPELRETGFEMVGTGDEEEATFVDVSGRPLSHEQQAALSRRIRHAMEQTLPLGTPTPGPVQTMIPPSQRGPNAYNAYKQTILLGGRQSPLVGAAPPEPAEPAPVSTRAEPQHASLATPLVPAAPPGQVPFSQAPFGEAPFGEPVSSEGMADGLALRGSFVRAVGLPTAPPPRRSRRPLAPEGMDLESEAPFEEEHEAFKLDRPLGNASLLPPEPASAEPPPWKWPEPRASWEPALRVPLPDDYPPPVSAPLPGALPDLRNVMLPPRPGPGDFDPPSSPSTASGAAAGLGRSAAPLGHPAVRPPAPQPLFGSLPSANPFAGFEAPSESFAQRFLIVFIVALAVVGVFALAAIAFGFLGKTGW
jgi:hypothetical protein